MGRALVWLMACGRTRFALALLIAVVYPSMKETVDGASRKPDPLVYGIRLAL